MKSRDEMITELREGVCLVKFEKVDGSERIMYATLEPSAIPEEKKETSEKKFSDSAIRVFDVDLQEWRAFKVNNVQFFEKLSKNMSSKAVEVIMEYVQMGKNV